MNNLSKNDQPLKVSGYKIVTSTSSKELSEEVNSLLKDGWYLLGGLIVDDVRMSQVLIKY